MRNLIDHVREAKELSGTLCGDCTESIRADASAGETRTQPPRSGLAIEVAFA